MNKPINTDGIFANMLYISLFLFALLNSIIIESQNYILFFAFWFTLNAFVIQVKLRMIPFFTLYTIFLTILYYILFRTVYSFRTQVILIICGSLFYIYKYLAISSKFNIYRFVIDISILNSLVCFTEVIFSRNIYLELLGLTSYGEVGSGRVCGITPHPIPCAILALFGFVFSSYLYRVERKNIYLFFIFLNLISILLTQSRSAYLCLLFIAIVAASKTIRNAKSIKLRHWVISIWLFIFLFIYSWYSIVQNGFIYDKIIKRIFSLSDSTSGSLLQRTGSINFIISYIHENFLNVSTWIGHGFDSLLRYLTANQIYFVVPGYYVVDNQYVTLIYDLGLLNFLILLIFLFSIFKNIRYADNSVVIDLFVIVLISVFFFEFTGFIICVLLFPLPFSLIKKGSSNEHV